MASDQHSNTPLLHHSNFGVSMKTLLLTNEYPPHTYGGAGVHVEYLSRELAKLMPVEVRCFGDQRIDQGNLKVTGFEVDTDEFTCPKPLRSVFGAVRRCTDFNSTDIDADLVHCHTWYTHLGGVLAKKNYGIPLVITVHSLEPLRPWKREQLAGGYDFSVWLRKRHSKWRMPSLLSPVEPKPISSGCSMSIPARVPVIYNGIDLEEYHKVDTTAALKLHGVDPAKPFLLFVGRITRQKGIVHLVRAIQFMDPGFQIVLCAGAPDTPEIAEEMKAAVEQAKSKGADVIWIREMLDKKSVIEFYSHAAVFCCPSIYEPFGIINLEAMACETAVVASAVGGITEVVVDGETGFLVPLEQMTESPFEPIDPVKFSRDLAAKINLLMANPELRQKFGKAGRKRAEEKFSWSSIARETKALYESLVSRR